MVVQVPEIIGLHDHVVELEEAQAALHALLVAFRPEHIVHGEAASDFAEQLDVVQVQQPVRVVHKDGLIFPEFDEPVHLLHEAVHIVLNGLRGHHGAHIRAAGGVAHLRRTAADQHHGLVPGHLLPLHQAERHEVAHMEGVRRGVKANVEPGTAGINQFADLFFIRDLRDQAPGLEFFINSHNRIRPPVLRGFLSVQRLPRGGASEAF